MIKIIAKYNEHKKATSIDRSYKKACSLEALSIIAELTRMLLNNDKTMTQAQINKIIKEMLKDENNGK